MVLKLGYWKIRGLAHQLRLYLTFLNVDYEEELYERGENDAGKWLTVKYQLGYDFPNLPYLQDGDHKITETHAIVMYIMNKYDKSLNDETKSKIFMTYLILNDIRWKFVACAYNPNFDQLSKEFFAKLPDLLKPVESYLEKNEWLSGAQVNFADFVGFDLFTVLKAASPEAFNNFPKCKAIIDKVAKLPQLENFLKSDMHTKLAFNNTIASWGNKPM